VTGMQRCQARCGRRVAKGAQAPAAPGRGSAGARPEQHPRAAAAPAMLQSIQATGSYVETALTKKYETALDKAVVARQHAGGAFLRALHSPELFSEVCGQPCAASGNPGADVASKPDIGTVRLTLTRNRIYWGWLARPGREQALCSEHIVSG